MRPHLAARPQCLDAFAVPVHDRAYGARENGVEPLETKFDQGPLDPRLRWLNEPARWAIR